jgi:ABC-type uncharacterized transport system ATPase component
MAALFRLVELSSGSILIDGLDISQLGLRQLRSRISIIPQDPFIFSGTFDFLTIVPVIETADMSDLALQVRSAVIWIRSRYTTTFDFGMHCAARIWSPRHPTRKMKRQSLSLLSTP